LDGVDQHAIPLGHKITAGKGSSKLRSEGVIHSEVGKGYYGSGTWPAARVQTCNSAGPVTRARAAASI